MIFRILLSILAIALPCVVSAKTKLGLPIAEMKTHDTSTKKAHPRGASFCENPVAAICEHGGGERRGDWERVMERMESLTQKVAGERDLLSRGLGAPSLKERTKILERVSKQRAEELQRAQELMNRQLNRFGNPHPLFQEIKIGIFAQLVSQNFPEEIRNKARTVRFAVGFNQFNLLRCPPRLASSPLTHCRDDIKNRSSLHDFACSANGTLHNAYYSPEDNAVILCEGTILKAAFHTELGDASEREARFADFLTDAIGHEVGHSIDNTRFPQPYQAMEQCLFERFGQGVARFRFNMWMGELIGDRHGLPQVVSRLRLVNTRAEKLVVLRRTFGSYCNTENSESHPSGELRLSIRAQYPALAEAMGCPPATQQNPVCDLNGRIP